MQEMIHISSVSLHSTTTVIEAVPVDPIQIAVCERMADRWYDFEGKEHPKYHAQIIGHNEWGAGKSPSEAIGNLVQSHP